MPQHSADLTLSAADDPAGTSRTEAQFQQALAFHQGGQLARAQTLYEEILRLQPQHVDALHLLGVLAAQTRHPQKAVEWIGRAIQIDPTNAMMHFNGGAALQELGQWEAARDSYDRAVAIDANFAEAYSNRALALKELGQLQAAVDSCKQAIGIKANFAQAHFNCGVVLHELNEREAALASYEQAIAIRPAYAEALFNRGNVQRELERWEAALASFDAAIALKAGYAAAYANRGNVRRELKRWDGALADYDRAIALKPDDALNYSNRGNVHRELKRWDAALADYDRALAIDANFAQAHCNRGVVLKELNQWDAALASYDRAIAIDANFAEAHANKGDALRELRQCEAAIASFDRALELKANLKNVFSLRLFARMQICDWRGFDAELARLAGRIERNEAVESPFCLLALSANPSLQKTAAQNWAHSECPANLSLPAISGRIRQDRIRLGYFSADFRVHPVSLLTAELFETHDRSHFEVTAFSLGPNTQDEVRNRLEGAFDRFIDVRNRSDRDIALLARELGIDIAIDLGGFTEGCRPAIFAMRAAPLQINYLGYPGTVGAGYMDYLIADRTVIPENHRQHYVEKIIYLPNCCLPHDSKRRIADTVPGREEFGLPPDAFVFCCFNNHFKITPGSFDCWMRILRRVDGSVLWLSEGDPTVSRHLRLAAHERGVDGDRLVFAKRLPSLPEHLARHRLADLFLDTLPYNAHATALDALWAGLPVLTQEGETLAGRVAASLLRAVGLPELICATREQYEDLAVALAEGPRRLASIRQSLADHRATMPLFDLPRYVKDLEAAYAMIQRRYQANLSAEDIHLESA
jgi:predicted O-linked N-acetylglucosamine transferase (SPINDLY family)